MGYVKNRIWNIEYGIWKKGLRILGSFFSKFQIQNSKFYQKGLATLPTVILLGIVSLVIAVGITTLSFTELFISQGNSQSSKALFYAEAGARDALIKIARNKTYLCATTDCYTIDFSTSGCSTGNDCAKVQVTGNDTSKTVTSKGIMKASTRILQATVTLDTDGAITGTTWSEVTN
ncbi:MAG: hypothetical protein UY07_C0020G0012 [Parcubacteria group bacterium GW2011_GWA1_47_8]|nr:MAG: hypothetical protein UY07_C0020G0012 [Parcubacteria group bacterium GW2011_GWA1_47_8]